jgi:hypothetical protein
MKDSGQLLLTKPCSGNNRIGNQRGIKPASQKDHCNLQNHQVRSNALGLR